jgi:hypothetical protein
MDPDRSGRIRTQVIHCPAPSRHALLEVRHAEPGPTWEKLMAQPGIAETVPPVDVLRALQDKLRANQVDAARLTSEADMLAQDVAGLQGDLDAVESAVAEYDAAGLTAVESERKESLDNLRTCVTAVLGDAQDAAQGIVDGLKTDIEQASQARDDAQAARDQAAADVETATVDVDGRQKAWDDLVGLTGRKTGELAGVAALVDGARSAEAAGNTFGAFARITEAERGLSALGDLPSTDEYRGQLLAAWQALADARQVLREARLALTVADLDLTAKTAALDALTSDRVTVLEQRWQNRSQTPGPARPAPEDQPVPPANQP